MIFYENNVNGKEIWGNGLTPTAVYTGLTPTVVYTGWTPTVVYTGLAIISILLAYFTCSITLGSRNRYYGVLTRSKVLYI